MGGLVVVVFSDLVESTALLAELGDDRMERVRRAHIDDVSGVVNEEGGRVVKTLGDGVMSCFDSALSALRAAAGIQVAVGELDAAQGGIGVAARVGVAAGEPIADGEDLHGMAVVLASRLSSAAGAGEVLVQEVVRSLVASRDGFDLREPAEYELKGVPEPVCAWKLRWPQPVPAADAPDSAAVSHGGADRKRLPLPRALAAYAEEPLVGRDEEIALLREASAAREGRRAVLLLGEPGIGKTRLAAAAAGEAHERGAVVAIGRCPREPVIAFEPWVRAIGELAAGGDDSWVGRLAEGAGPELAALVPELSERAVGGAGLAAGSVIAAEGARYRLLHGIGSALACATGDAPLYLVLDDAHWCDPASAQALEHLLEGAAVPRLVLLVTARDRELGRRHPVSKVLAQLRRTGDLEELRLEGLDSEGMAALVGARLGRSIRSNLAARLGARTGGNPFFAGELARDLDERGALREGDEFDDAPIPDAVAGMVEERLARLEPATERLLTAAAAIGPSAPVALAARAAALDGGEARSAVEQALSERLVDDVVALERTIAFPHALVREALLAGAGDATKVRLHQAIAEALEEDPVAEPAELARHHGAAVELTGPAPAIAAYRKAAAAAAEAHDHEQAAAQLRSVLALLGENDIAARASVLLELGEQELLSADLGRARQAFMAALEAARETGDGRTLARAALDFSGGDVGFGWEIGNDDPATVVLLREGMEALGEQDPRLTLRMTFRLAYLSIYSDDDEQLQELAHRAERLGDLLDDPEARLLARFTVLTTKFARYPDPPRVYDLFEGSLDLVAMAEKCERADLLFRVVLWSASALYVLGRSAECDAAVERARQIASRLGSPRFTWEVDAHRGARLLDQGEREAGEALVRRAGAVVRRLRPDIHVSLELTVLTFSWWVYGGRSEGVRAAFEAMEAALPDWGFQKAAGPFALAVDGDMGAARERLWPLLEDDLEQLRRPDGHLPVAIAALVYAAVEAEDIPACQRLRPLLEQYRSYVIVGSPMMAFGLLPEWQLGRIDLIEGRYRSAVEEFRGAIGRVDEQRARWASAWARVDLALALFRAGDSAAAELALAEAEAIAAEHGVELVAAYAREARAAIEGREPAPGPTAVPKWTRPVRALASRGGRRALEAMVRRLDEEELERRFVDPGRQRALLKAMARGFQPARAAGFSGVIVYELEPYAIPPPPDAPWRWAIEVDSGAGRARLLEPAPLEAAVTIHIGLADWVRVVAGLHNASVSMVAGRCRVEGDVLLAVRLEAMFGGG